MTLTCKTCGAENAPDAAACWNCEASGEAFRGARKGSPIVWIAATVVALGALGGGVWWTMLRDGAPYAGMLNFASAPPPAPAPAPQAHEAESSGPQTRAQLPDWMRPFVTRPDDAPAPAPGAAPDAAFTSTVPAAGEAILIADPVDGPFYVLFKQQLPADYAATLGPLLAQVSDPSQEPARFDALLSEKLEALQRANAVAIAQAETPVLAGMAAGMHRSLRTPDICRAAMTNTQLDHGHLDARHVAAASNMALVRAVASGRASKVSRQPPQAQDIEAFNRELQARLPARIWPIYLAGEMGDLPVEDQCAILSAYWGIIAGYPAEKAAQWTAWQMGGLAAAQ